MAQSPQLLVFPLVPSSIPVPIIVQGLVGHAERLVNGRADFNAASALADHGALCASSCNSPLASRHLFSSSTGRRSWPHDYLFCPKWIGGRGLGMTIEARLLHFQNPSRFPVLLGLFPAVLAVHVLGAGGAGKVMKDGRLDAPHEPCHCDGVLGAEMRVSRRVQCQYAGRDDS
jgi:hypothetical protein